MIVHTFLHGSVVCAPDLLRQEAKTRPYGPTSPVLEVQDREYQV
jgi:hypothetical protein